MLCVDNVYKSAKRKNFFDSRKPILKGVSLRVPEGKIVAIIGENGAGKSTLIKSIMSFTGVDSGAISLRNGVKMGYLPENPYYYDYLTLRELLWFSASSFSVPSSVFDAKCTQVAASVDMENELKSKLRVFSKGMTQRAGIAAALIHDPDLLIFDEPMSGLDPVGRNLVFNLLSSLRAAGKTVLFCSHILSDVERLCDEVYIMHDGRIESHLTKHDLEQAQKRVKILLGNSASARRFVDSSRLEYHLTEKHITIFVESCMLNFILKDLFDRGIDIENIISESNVLEGEFMKINRRDK